MCVSSSVQSMHFFLVSFLQCAFLKEHIEISQYVLFVSKLVSPHVSDAKYRTHFKQIFCPHWMWRDAMQQTPCS